MRLRHLLGWLSAALVAAGAAQAQDPVKIGFITKFPVPFFTSMEDAAKAYAAANPGVEITFGQGASATDIEGQIALIESMVTNGVQGIAITPVDPTVATALDKAIEGGVKVVLMDNNIPDWQGRTALATTDNSGGGQDRGRVPQDGAQARRHARHPRGRARRAVARRPGERDARGAGRRRGQHRRPRRHQLHRGARHQRRRGPADREPGPEGDLFRLRSARGRRGAGDRQRRQGARRHHPGRLRLLLRRGRGADRRHRGRNGRAVPDQDGRARRRRAGQGDPRREGRVADRTPGRRW